MDTKYAVFTGVENENAAVCWKNEFSVLWRSDDFRRMITSILKV